MKKPQTNEIETLRRVLASKWIRSFEFAIDGGANVGDWTMEMADHFGLVMAFEPGEVCKQLSTRVGNNPHVAVYQMALLDKSGTVEVYDPRNGGKPTGYAVRPKADGDIIATTIDSYGLKSCGLIKLDLEGAEPLAIMGARETIRRCSPVLIVEIARHSRRFGFQPFQVTQMVLGLGYKLALQIPPNQIFIPA